MNIFKNTTKKDMVTVVLLLFLSVAGAYYYVNPGLGQAVAKKLYPLQAQAALAHVECSAGSPPWLAEMLHYVTVKQDAPANQMAYISPQGQLSHCESGYVGTPWLSDKVGVQTRFRYASVSKLWTADAVLQLVNQGKLSLDTRLLDVLTDVPPPTDPRVADITIGQLLRHEGGFDRYGIFAQDMFNPGQTPLCPQHLDQLATMRLGFAPGSKSSYSNLGYCLLGEVVARVNGRPYTQQMVQQYKLADAGIRFLENRRFDDEVALNYRESGLTGGVGDIYTAYDYPALASAAGFSGSAAALAEQVKGMLNRPGLNILSQPPGLRCGQQWLGACYGYAMSPYQPRDGGLKVFVRSGALLGAASLVMVDEHGGITVLLSNGRAEQPEQGVAQKQELLYRYLQKQYAAGV